MIFLPYGILGQEITWQNLGISGFIFWIYIYIQTLAVLVVLITWFSNCVWTHGSWIDRHHFWEYNLIIVEKCAETMAMEFSKPSLYILGTITHFTFLTWIYLLYNLRNKTTIYVSLFCKALSPVPSKFSYFLFLKSPYVVHFSSL